MKEGRTLVKEAVKDAKSLKQAALESAKNEIVNALAPGLKTLLDRTVRESVDRYSGSSSDYYGSDKERKYEEGKDKGDDAHMDDKKDKMQVGELDMESLAAFFPQLAELGADDGEEPAMGDEQGMEGMEGQEQEDEGLGMSGIPTLGEEPEMHGDEEELPVKEAKEEEEGDMDEAIEISEAELRKVYEQALQTEVTVKKNFSDFTAGGELDQAHKDTGILDTKSGEAGWETQEVPASEDWIPEGKKLQKLVRAGMAENRALKAKLSEAYKAVKALGGKLHEVNLFNAKVLHVNRLLNKHGRLSTEQKKIAIESLDKARSISEVKTMFETVDKMFRASGKSLSESTTRKPTASAQKVRTSGAPKQVLRESADRGQGQANNRWTKLAGIVNK